MNTDPHHIYLMPTSQRILRAIVDERRRVLARVLHARQPPRPPLEERLAQLKSQTEAYREQAILLNAKLATMSSDLQGVSATEGVIEVEKLRETLLQSSAQIDHGVAKIVGDDDKIS